MIWNSLTLNDGDTETTRQLPPAGQETKLSVRMTSAIDDDREQGQAASSTAATICSSHRMVVDTISTLRCEGHSVAGVVNGESTAESAIQIRAGDHADLLLRWFLTSEPKPVISGDGKRAPRKGSSCDNIIKLFLDSSKKEGIVPTIADIVHQWFTETSVHGSPFAFNVHF